MHQSREMDWQRTGNVFVFLLLVVVIAVAIGAMMWVILPWPAHADWTKVAGEWEQYRLNESQKQWFKTVRPNRKGPACCDIADGHPTMADHRVDGWYVPNYFHPDHDWLKVPEEAMTTPGTNPVGVATVWFGSQDADGNPYIRCFVPESEI